MRTNLPERLLKALVYIVITFAIYIALPFAAIGTGRADIYIIIPLLDCCAACAVGYFYGRKHGRDPIMPIFSALLFLPCMFVFYNISAWIYLPIAALASYLGECIGKLYQGKFGR